MALLTGGTSSTTVLSALKVAGNMGAAGTNLRDLGTLNNLIKTQGTYQRIEPASILPSGLLVLPGKRGVITCEAGDYIMVDPVSGWPIVVSATAITGGSFVHS